MRARESEEEMKKNAFFRYKIRIPWDAQFMKKNVFDLPSSRECAAS